MGGAWWPDQLTFLLLNSVWSILCAAQSLCFQCSDPNIEVHYGAFFNNPRILQDDSANGEAEPRCDSAASARIRICRDPCYTLNVTTQDIRTGRLLPFGVSHGCSTVVLAPSRIHPRGCHQLGIVLRTTPAHPLHAQYCFCTGDACNVIRPVHTVTRSAAPRFKMQDSKLVTREKQLTEVTSKAAKPQFFGALVLLFVLVRNSSYCFAAWCYS